MMDDPDTDPLTEFWQSSPGFSTSLNLNFRKSSLSPPRESLAFSRSTTDTTYTKTNSTKQTPKISKSNLVASSSLSSSTISQSSSSLPSSSTSIGINPGNTIIPVTSPSNAPSPSKIVKFMVREKGDSSNSEPSILPLGINTSNNNASPSSTDLNKSKGQLPPPVLLKTMSAFELTQLEDYLHCVKCYRTFYKLETLVSHFKTCPGKPNGSFEEFMRKKRSDSNYDYDLPSTTTTTSKSQKHNSSISMPSPIPSSSQSGGGGGGFTRLQDDDFEHDNDDMDYSDDFPMINSSTSILNEINMRNIWKSTPSSSTNRNIISSSSSNVRTPLRGMSTREPESDNNNDTEMLDLDPSQAFPSPLIASFLSRINKDSDSDSHSSSPSLYKNINTGKRNMKGQVPFTKQYIISDRPSPPSTSSLLQKVGKKGQIIQPSLSEVKTYTPRKEDNEVRNSLTPFSCSHCPFVTGRNIDLMEHYEFKHPNIKVFKCPVVSCRESFLEESELKIHASVHEPKPVCIPVKSSHMCQHCRKLFISKEFLNSHILRVHSNKNETNTDTNSNYNINKGTVSRPFPCSFFPCQRTYTTLIKLKQHEKIHSDTKLHICNVCKKSFTFKQVYVDHLKTHNVPSNMDINKASTSSSPSTSTSTTITPTTTTTTTLLDKNSQLQKILQQNAQVQIQQPSASLVAAVNKVNPNILKNRVIKVIRVRGNANMPSILSSSEGTKNLVNFLSTNKPTTSTTTTTSIDVVDPTTTTTETTIGENPNPQENEIETQDITMENSQDFMKDLSSELNNNNDSNNESSNIVDDDSNQIQTENLDQSGEGEEETQAVAIDSDLEQVESDIVNKL